MAPTRLVIGASCKLISHQSIKDDAKFDGFADTQSQEDFVLHAIKAGNKRKVVKELNTREISLWWFFHAEFGWDHRLWGEELDDSRLGRLAKTVPLSR